MCLFGVSQENLKFLGKPKDLKMKTRSLFAESIIKMKGNGKIIVAKTEDWFRIIQKLPPFEVTLLYRLQQRKRKYADFRG